MSIRDKWGAALREMDKELSFKLLDAFFDAGGNFIDMANNYQDESSESFIRELAENRGICDQLVITTSNCRDHSNFKARNDTIGKKVTYVGDGIKSMHISVKASLKKLHTTYINILYAHWWHWATGIEVMNELHNLVVQGKVLYLIRADRFSRLHLPNSCSHSGAHGTLWTGPSSTAPWNVLTVGKLCTDTEEQQHHETSDKSYDDTFAMGSD
ncbi:NADP-dependent oxidoreductase domain-containing protein [Mycena sp. CBHHK59/15]|nr:NADP-dependent oxidoreductase domain-containing protein [Mycena sp. CBHHK59/15]